MRPGDSTEFAPCHPRAGRSWPRPLAALIAAVIASSLSLLSADSGAQEGALPRRAGGWEQSRALRQLETRTGAWEGTLSRLSAEWGFEAPVDPNEYRVGPGDELVLSIGSPTDLLLPLTVTADGALLIPSVGAVDLRRLTLREAEQLVAERCRPAYPQALISLHLVRPALLRIPVTGLVTEPGIYTLPGTARLADLLQVAGGLRPSADSRRIQVGTRDDAVRLADYLTWRTLGRGDGNPLLRSGEQVHVPPATASYRVRGTYGVEDEPAAGSSVIDRPFEPQVRLIAAKGGDDLAFVIEAAGGLPAGHCETGVWVTRATGERDRRPINDDVDADDDERDDEHDDRNDQNDNHRNENGKARIWVPLDACPGFKMRPGDIVDVPFCREWIAVAGSINRPGLYPYLAGQTVGDYVLAAGGPTLTGKNNGWEIWDPVTGERHSAAPQDTLSAGEQVWVPERRAHKISTLLTPIGTAVALVVSIVALTR